MESGVTCVAYGEFLDELIAVIGPNNELPFGIFLVIAATFIHLLEHVMNELETSGKGH